MWLLLSMMALANPPTAPLTADVAAALSPRHVVGAPCDAVAALGPPEVVLAALLDAVATVTMPPWVGTRAARCVVARMDTTPEAADAARTWLMDPAQPGLALIVVDHLDALPKDAVRPLAELAIQRVSADPTFARLATPRLSRSTHAFLRARAAELPE